MTKWSSDQVAQIRFRDDMRARIYIHVPYSLCCASVCTGIGGGQQPRGNRRSRAGTGAAAWWAI